MVSETVVPEPPFPAIALVLRHSRTILVGASGIALALLLWLALRTGWLELVVFAPLAAFAVHFVLRVAIEVVSLVAETLMPR